MVKLARAFLLFLLGLGSVGAADLDAVFRSPPPPARPWVFWYWMNAAVTREGITADLQAMKEAGLGGAYLMPIKGATTPPLVTPPALQLTPEWWDLVRHAMREADRLGLALAFHVADGFATAGGPWITPAQSMQRVVWTESRFTAGEPAGRVLPAPPAKEDYYRDIAVLAFPTRGGPPVTTRTTAPRITSSSASAATAKLAAADNREMFRSEGPCWIQYEFAQPFTARSLIVRPGGANPQANRFVVEASDDGVTYRFVARLEPPRHGWQDGDFDVTHALPATTARFFRFSWDKAATEPGAEDLDFAKWKPNLKVQELQLSGLPRLHQYEGKNGQVWRVSRETTTAEVPEAACVPLDQVLDLTAKMDGAGRLDWRPESGEWTVLRIGHTSTGQRNATGGGGQGLECDKFDPAAVRLQFDSWFGECIRQVGPELAARVLQVFHVDSWECGSQNWSANFRREFQARRGYDLLPYLPAMAGVPVQSAAASEKFLRDVRTTIAELIADHFFGTLRTLARERGCEFSAEAVAPTMVSDGLRHFDFVDLPMGEFWLRSPTHDKLNDMLDAISGARIYGKRVVQAEAFTEVRMAWDEHPAMLKALGDRNFALGINRLVLHVFAHNPWTDRRPGVTLDGVGLYFQRDQTWWKPGRAWVDYLSRCQALLQCGVPVADLAVYTGDEVPGRAVRPDQLVTTLPGLLGTDAVARELARRENRGEPMAESPRGVNHAANLVVPEDWTDPLRGYAYDSINRDALLRLATVREGRLELPGGASYRALVLPGPRAMEPAAGAHRPDGWTARIAAWRAAGLQVVDGVERAESLAFPRDFLGREADGSPARGLAWTHRRGDDFDLYFVSNQRPEARTFTVSLRTSGRVPELWDAVTGEQRPAGGWTVSDGRTEFPVSLAASGSVFVVLRSAGTPPAAAVGGSKRDVRVAGTFDGGWEIEFDSRFGGPNAPVMFAGLDDWAQRRETSIRFYSGTAVYRRGFTWNPARPTGRVWLDLGRVDNLAEVTVNGVPCGVAWTAPWRVDITAAVRPGANQVAIAVTNTWANRLTGDRTLPAAARFTMTTAPYRLDGSLLPAGLRGPVTVQIEE